MGKVVTGATMSLDGYISGPGESGFDKLFAWYGNGDVAIPTANPTLALRVSPENARVWRETVERAGALVVGRKTFDQTDGWSGVHPLGVPVFVVTHRPAREWQARHPDAPFTFVKEGVAAAIAKAHTVAGGKDVVVTAGSIASQALDAGLLDEVNLSVAPVVLGGGTPFFMGLRHAPFPLPDAEVVQAQGVTHLRYAVPKRPRVPLKEA